MDDSSDVRGLEITIAEDFGYPGRHGAGRVVVRRQDLPADLGPALMVVDDDIGEGPADINTEGVARHQLCYISTEPQGQMRMSAYHALEFEDEPRRRGRP